MEKTNSQILEEFYRSVLSKLEIIESHIDVGHRKNIRFPKFVAGMYPDKKIVYYDTSRFIKRTRKQKVPENLFFSNKPEPGFDSASFFFTLHDFKNPFGAIKRAYKLLKEAGKIIIIDYDLAWIRDEEMTEEEKKKRFVEIFNAVNEKDVIKKEEDWYENHTRYSLEQCIKDAREAGFFERLREVQERKLFLYIGEKIE